MRSSVRVIDNLLKQVATLKSKKTALSSLHCASTVASNPLLQDWTKTEPFGLPPFSRIEPAHFKPAFDEAMAMHLKELASVAVDGEKPSFENVIASFDRCGAALTKVSMVFSNLTSSLNTEPLQVVQTEMAPILAGHSNKTYTMPGLFEKIDAVYQARESLGLTSEQLRLTERIHLDFTRAGAKFDEAQKKAYGELMEEQAALETQFQQNVMADESSFTIVLKKADLSGCPADLIESAKQAAVDFKKGADDYVITLSRSLVEPFITFSDRRDLREQAWQAWTKRGELDPSRDNQKIAQDILRLRKKQANFHGCSNFAIYQVCDVPCPPSLHILTTHAHPHTRIVSPIVSCV
jgi:peptidyl-dipeptidase Dcp